MKPNLLRTTFSSLRRVALAKLLLLAVVSSGGFSLAAAAPLAFHVAPGGSDDHPGTEAAPFATVARARDALRAATGRSAPGAASLPAGWTGAEIVLHGGSHYLREPLALDGRDSGTAAYPVVFRGRPGESVVISAGVPVPASLWKSVNDPLVRARLRPEVVESVRQLDLRELGVKDLGDLGVPGRRLDLIMGGNRMIPARWPNEGWGRVGSAGTGSFPMAGDGRRWWPHYPPVWLHGYWTDEVQDRWNLVRAIDAKSQVISLEQPLPEGGIGADRWFEAFNVLEELDQPGEWWLDRLRMQILCLPRSPGDLGSGVITGLASVVTCSGASWISFTNLSLEASRSHAFVAAEGTGLRLDAVGVRHAGGWGVRIEGGADARISNSVVTGTGEGGIYLRGGDRAALSPGGHVVEASTVRDFARAAHAGNPGILLEGVGAAVRACQIEDGPHAGIRFAGNEHTIEGNTFRRLCLTSAATGAVEAAGDWAARGTVIRENTFEDIVAAGMPAWATPPVGPAAVLLADGISGTTVRGNRFERCGYGVVVGGGRDNLVEDNTFSATATPIYLTSAADVEGLEDRLRAALSAVPYLQSTAWTQRYPALASILAEDPVAPRNNRFAGNRALDKAWLLDASGGARAFVPADLLNFTSTGASVALQALLAYATAPAAGRAYDGLVLYVARGGNDANPGTESLPFATLERARDAIRAATGRTVNGGAPGPDWRGAQVVFRPGTYYLDRTIFFDNRDSGTAEHPLEITAEAGAKVVLSGAYPVNDTAWELATAGNDPKAHARLPSGAAGQVYRLNVRALGIDTGSLSAFQSELKKTLRLIVGDRVSTMSRYPNWPDNVAANWLKLRNFSGGGNYGWAGSMSYETTNEALASWKIEEESVFAQGSLDVPYHVQWQPVSGFAAGSSGGTRISVPTKTIYYPVPFDAAYESGTEQFICIRNAIRGLAAGSYAWVPAWGYLYYHSPSGAPTGASLTVTPQLIGLGSDSNWSSAVNWVTFRDLVFEGARYSHLNAYDCTGVRLEDCEIRNGGYTGFEFRRCWRSGMLGGSVHHLAQQALLLGGGDENTMVHSGNFLDGVEIHEIGYDLNATISSAITTGPAHSNQPLVGEGHGLTIRNVHMHDIRDGLLAPGMGGVTIEDSTFERFLMITGDSGGISAAFKFTLQDNLVRGCTFRDAPRLSLHHPAYGATTAVYLDLSAGWTFEDNLFENLDHAIYFGGKNITIRRNRFSNSGTGHWGAPLVALPRQGHVAEGSVARNSIVWDLEAAPLDRAPWTERFPTLIQYRTNGARSAILGHHENPVIVDNVQMTAGRYLLRMFPVDAEGTSKGFPVGVRLGQLNYPAGTSALPVAGQGGVALSALTYNSW